MLNPGQFERRVSATGMVALLGAFVFFGALSYWQIFRTDLAGKPGNPRILAEYRDPNRGRILDREGNVLAESLPDGTRRYTDASVAHALGYIDPRYGSQGAELAFNGYLSGEKAASWKQAFNTELLRDPERGLDVRLTLDPAIQSAATQALGGRTGAVIALDPKSGEVLAMLSVPTYDPGALEDNGEALLADPLSPLLNRATQGNYPPGSTFKTLTAASALEHGVIEPDTTVTCPGEIVVEGFPISCSNVPQGIGTYPFRDAFTYSVNAIFGQVGVDLGWPALIETSRKLGFGAPLDFTLETAPTQLFNDGDDLSKPLLASTAFGQGELLATPLQMAVVAAAIANDGVLMRPHIGLAAYDGTRKAANIEQPSGRRVLDAGVAAIMRDFMVSVIDNGQANGVAIDGVKVGGKTGTAESGTPGLSHAWFIAFAPADDPVIAVAVVVEDGGQGGVVASPIAGEVIRAALAR
ncbi:MAG: penicillin-binding transpeptidase domain-containing protein [Dehalococcoidia bacterium]|nr:penicillin-binding transpeptidase domain-containing protein [Dehalococcoidia bacterium]